MGAPDPIRQADGRYGRVRQPWSPRTWDDGYLDAKGSMRVYRPDCPGAYENGYALRARVVYWLETGTVPGPGEELRHRDLCSTNDQLDNLILWRPGMTLARKRGVDLQCAHCRKTFTMPAWRVRAREKATGFKPLYCSSACYHAGSTKGLEHAKSRLQRIKDRLRLLQKRRCGQPVGLVPAVQP